MAESESAVPPAAEPDYPRGITFEQVWAAIMADRKENDRREKEAEQRREENERRLEETEQKREENERRRVTQR